MLPSSDFSRGSSFGSPFGPSQTNPFLPLSEDKLLSSWLSDLHFEEYIPLFKQAGYDMPTITRMTPEDLTAIGITKPNHRQKLKAEIAKLNIPDGIPYYKPDSLLKWLQILRLEEYHDTLCRQKCDTIDKVTDLTWEDLEDIGIQKLGHQKKILLAIKRIDDINQGRCQIVFPTLGNKRDNSYLWPSTIGVEEQMLSCDPLDKMQCWSQEGPILTSGPPAEAVQEMKTLQPSDLFLQAIHNSAQNSNGTQNTTSLPTQVRSFDSLSSDSMSELKPFDDKLKSTVSQNKSVLNIGSSQAIASHSLSQQPVSPEQVKSAPKEWQVTDLDSTTELGCECEGTASLSRPKGLVKLNPMATKRSGAKTREEIAEAIMDIPDREFKSLISETRTLDGWSSLDGSPRHAPATVPRNAALKRAPPPVPKRSNPPKGEKSQPVVADPSKVSKVPENSPPVVEGSVATDELFSNPLFRQMLNDSSNKPVNTAKMKLRPCPSLPLDCSPSSNKKEFLREKNSQELTSSVEHEYVAPDNVSPGDVIDDIENMLANLSDQLDAMMDT